MPRQHTFSLPHVAEDGSQVNWQYRVDLMPPMRAHDLLRRFAPPIAGKIAQAFAGRGPEGAPRGEVIGQVVSSLGDISQADHDHVVGKMLEAVKVRQDPSGPWADLWNPSQPFDRGLMFPIDLDELYQILWEVAEFTYGNFIQRVSQMSKDMAGSR